MREMMKLGLILLIITSVAAVVLGITNNITQGVILERKAEAIKDSLVVLVPDADDFAMLQGVSGSGVSEAYEGTKGGTPVGYVFKAEGNGYGGAIEVLVAISSEGKVLDLQIGANAETPGIGDKVQNPEFIGQFVDQDATGEVQVEIISGATRSSNGVIGAVNAAAKVYQEAVQNR